MDDQNGQRGGLAAVAQMPMRLPPPPEELNLEQSELWRRIVATKPFDWWDEGSAPLLTAYCRAIVESHRVGRLVDDTSRALATDPDELTRYKELRKIQAGLSGEITTLGRQMRLTQQSKYRADAAFAAEKKAGSGKRPWLT